MQKRMIPKLNHSFSRFYDFSKYICTLGIWLFCLFWQMFILFFNMFLL